MGTVHVHSDFSLPLPKSVCAPEDLSLALARQTAPASNMPGAASYGCEYAGSCSFLPATPPV